MIETTILSNLLDNEEYTRKTIPFLTEDYFSSAEHKFIFKAIRKYLEKYNRLPNKDVLRIAIDHRNDLNETQYKSTLDEIEKLQSETYDIEWLLDETEKFCQDKAIINAVRKSILIIEDKDSNLDKGSIPNLLSDALSVGFDTNIGHDFFENEQERFEFYHRKENKIPFDIEYMNRITKGGVSRKALIIALAGCVHPDTKVRIRYRKI